MADPAPAECEKFYKDTKNVLKGYERGDYDEKGALIAIIKLQQVASGKYEK